MRWILVCGGLVVAAPAGAQSVRLAPQIGLYVPTDRLYSLATGGVDEDFRLEAGPSFGARLGIWGRRVGFELVGSYVPTTFSFGSGATTKEDAKLYSGTGQVVVSLLPLTSPLSLFASGGVAAVSRGGLAFSAEAETTSIGGVVGLGAGLRIGGLGITIGADLLGYSAEYRGTQAVSQRRAQRDVNIRLGFGAPFGPQGSSGR